MPKIVSFSQDGSATHSFEIRGIHYWSSLAIIPSNDFVDFMAQIKTSVRPLFSILLLTVFAVTLSFRIFVHGGLFISFDPHDKKVLLQPKVVFNSTLLKYAAIDVAEDKSKQEIEQLLEGNIANNGRLLTFATWRKFHHDIRPRSSSSLPAVHFMDYTMCNVSHKAPLLVTDPRFDMLCARIVKYYSLKRFVEETGKSLDEWGSAHDGSMFHYSSGMQAVMLALGICDKVSIFGYGKSALAKHHYHTNQKAELRLHDYEAEYAFYQDMMENPLAIPFISDKFKIPPVSYTSQKKGMESLKNSFVFFPCTTKVLWAGRLCIYYALLKTGLAGSQANPFVSDAASHIKAEKLESVLRSGPCI
ncbi:hypothetical protein QYF36_022509 [Acer negundo]|nr:hypothetical protein QYF36_022509 [Acer negundo]